MKTRMVSLILCVFFLGNGQLAAQIPGDPDGGILAQARDKEAKAKVKGDCVLDQDKGKTVVLRRDYDQWVKDLICEYLETDYSDHAKRTAFVSKVLAAYRAHLGGNKPWSIDTNQTVVYIVTQEPYFLLDPTDAGYIKGEVTVGKQKKQGLMKRSLKDANSAVMGFLESLFDFKKPENDAEAIELVPRAERTLILIYGMKKMADLIRAHPEGMKKNVSVMKINAALDAFILHIKMKWEKGKPKFSGGAIAPRPPVPPQPAPASLNDAMNLNFNNEPGPWDQPIPITKTKRGQPLAVTNAGTQTTFHAYYSSQITAESIDERANYRGKNRHKVEFVVRTFFKAEITFGKYRAGSKMVKARIFSKNLEKDATPNIRRHELKHAKDLLGAWQSHYIAPLRKALSEFQAAGLTKTEPGAPLPVRGKNRNKVYIDFRMIYHFDTQKNMEKAYKLLVKRFKNRRGNRNYIASFLEEAERREQALHKKEAGINDEGELVPEEKLKAKGVHPLIPPKLDDIGKEEIDEGPGQGIP